MGLVGWLLRALPAALLLLAALLLRVANCSGSSLWVNLASRVCDAMRTAVQERTMMGSVAGSAPGYTQAEAWC
jgi:hypothetical protein